MPFTSITNTNPAVVTATGHGFNNGDIVIPISGWSQLSGKPMRVAASTANTFALENFDTSNTATYPILGGAGSNASFTKILTFIQIDQVLTSTTNGGEQQYTTFQPMASDHEYKLPTVISAQDLTLTIGDDPTLPGYQALQAAKQLRATRALLFSLPGGSKIYYSGVVGLNETPTTTVNQVMSVTASFSLTGIPTRFTS